VFLLETLDINCCPLLTQLFADQVLSTQEAEDIRAEQTSFRANEKLLSALSRKSFQQFQLFLDALDNCGQSHVRNVISDRPGLAYAISAVMLTRPDHSRPRPRRKPFHNAKAYKKDKVMKSCFSSTLTCIYATYSLIASAASLIIFNIICRNE